MKKKIISLLLIFIISIGLIGCSETKNNSRIVTGEIINVRSTAVVSNDITIKTENGNNITFGDTWNKCKQREYGTKIKVTLNNDGNLDEVEYLWEEN